MLVSLEKPVDHQRMEILTATMLFFFVYFGKMLLSDTISLSDVFLLTFVFCIWLGTSYFMTNFTF